MDMFNSIKDNTSFTRAYSLASDALYEYNKNNHRKSIVSLHKAAIELCRNLTAKHDDNLDDGLTLLSIINESKVKSYLPAEIISSFLYIAIIGDMVQRKKKGITKNETYAGLERLNNICNWLVK